MTRSTPSPRTPRSGSPRTPREGAELPFEVVEQRRARRASLYCYRPLTGAFIDERLSILGGLETYLPAVHALGATSGLSAYLESRGETVPRDPRERAEDALRLFLARVFDESTDFVLTDHRFESAYTELESVVCEGRTESVVVAPLLGVDLGSDELDMGEGLVLVRGEALPDAPVDADVFAVLSWEAAPGDAAPIEHARVRLRRLLTALRLYDTGVPALGAAAWAKTAGGPWQMVVLEFQPVVDLPVRAHPWCRGVGALGPPGGGSAVAGAIPRRRGRDRFDHRRRSGVLTEACRVAIDVLRDPDSGENLALFVNLSPRQLADVDLVPMVQEVIDLTGVDPQVVHFEITEDALMADAATTTSTLDQLHGLGVRLALDDFGTGHSSLGIPEAVPGRGAEDRPHLHRGLGPGLGRSGDHRDHRQRGPHARAVDGRRRCRAARSSRRAHGARLRLGPGLSFRPPDVRLGVGRVVASPARAPRGGQRRHQPWYSASRRSTKLHALLGVVGGHVHLLGQRLVVERSWRGLTRASGSPATS